MKTTKYQFNTGSGYPTGHHIEEAIDRGKRTAELIKERLSEKLGSVVLFCKGTSGLILASYVAKELIESGISCQISYYKGNEHKRAHSFGPVTYIQADYFIVDDIVDTGTTIQMILDWIRNSRSRIIVKAIIVNYCIGTIPAFDLGNIPESKMVVEEFIELNNT